jgi:hypothetical protein
MTGFCHFSISLKSIYWYAMLWMADEYKISVSLTRGELASYNFHHIRWLLWVDVIGVCLLLVGAYFSFTSPKPGVRSTLSVLVFWGVIFLAVGLSQPFILFLQIFIFKTPAVIEQMQPKLYAFDETGIHIEVGNRMAMTPWSRVFAIKAIDRLFLIYTSPKLAYIIPQRCFASREEFHRFAGLMLGRVRAEAGQTFPKI